MNEKAGMIYQSKPVLSEHFYLTEIVLEGGAGTRVLQPKWSDSACGSWMLPSSKKSIELFGGLHWSKFYEVMREYLGESKENILKYAYLTLNK